MLPKPAPAGFGCRFARMNTTHDQKPVVVVTGAAGGIGTTLCRALGSRYTVVGLDRV